MSRSNHAYKLYSVTITCYVLAFIGVTLRFCVRKFVVGKVALDDWLMAAALALYTIYVSFVFVGLSYGTGQHDYNLSEHNVIMGVRYWYFCEWAYVLTTTTMKVGVGIFYLGIMVKRWQNLLVKYVIGAVVIFGIAYFGCVVAQCVPVSFIWLRFSRTHHYEGACLPDLVVVWGTYLHSILSAIADWTLGLLPVTILWDVKMGWGTKAMLVFLLGLGALASTATLVRLSVIYHIIDLSDFLWDTLGIAIWSTVEPGVALFAVGLATIRPLLRIFFPTSFSNLAMPEIPTVGTIQSFGTPDGDCLPPPVTFPAPNPAPSLPSLPPLSPLPPIPSSYVPIWLAPDSRMKRSKSWRWVRGISERTITTVRSTDTRRTSRGHGEIVIVNDTVLDEQVATPVRITRPERVEALE